MAFLFFFLYSQGSQDSQQKDVDGHGSLIYNNPMNKTTKNEAKVKSLRNYLLSDKRFLTDAPGRNRFVKRTITRMMRRVNRTLCNVVEE